MDSFFLKQKMYIFMIIMSETLCRDVIQIIWEKFNLIVLVCCDDMMAEMLLIHNNISKYH